MAFIGYFLLFTGAVLFEVAEGDNKCPTEWYQEMSLNTDGTVFIQWLVSDGSITMNVIGKSKGWVGLGFSPAGGMTGADIAMGWVKDGKPYLQDLYATENGRPSIDDVQSYQLLGGSENETHTSICWTRKLDTCDEHDLPIQDGTQILIWAFNNEDPADMTMDAPQYHEQNRGTKDVRLLNKATPKPSLDNLKTFEILSINLTIPANTKTLYWCSVSKLPKMEKHHMIGNEPKFQEVGQEYLHHLVIYQCPGASYDSLYEEIPSKGFDCNLPSAIKYRKQCYTTVTIWAVGGEGQFYPNETALPFGKPYENSYYMLEAHYNIMNQKYVGKQDTSGVVMYYTSELRKYEAGILAVGENFTAFQVIPARQKSFSTLSICPPGCTQNTIPPEGINVFSLYFHAHIAGRKIRLHIFRNGTEVESKADEHFQFTYQQAIMYDKNFKIYPNDLMMVECEYDTSDRDNITVGYYGSEDEMCLVFIYSFPATNVSLCLSNLVDPKFLNLLGVEEYHQVYNEINVTKPEAFANRSLNDYLHQLDFPEEDVPKLQDMYYTLPKRTHCTDLEGLEIKTEIEFVTPPKIDDKFRSQSSNCTKP